MFDGDANRELFEEQVEVMVKAFNEEAFSHEGKHYQIPAKVPYRGYTLEKLSLVPRPLRQPVDIWQPLVSGNPKGVDFMARIGIKAMVANTPEPARHERLTMYQEAAAKYGRELALGEDIASGYRFFIGANREQAMKEAKPYFEEAMKFRWLRWVSCAWNRTRSRPWQTPACAAACSFPRWKRRWRAVRGSAAPLMTSSTA